MSTRVAPEYRIRLNIERPDPASYADFVNYPTATISDSYRRRQTLPPAIKPVWGPTPRIVGPAITVSATPADEILALKAIQIAQPGDVIVVAGAKHPLCCVWGGIMSTEAKAHGAAALVTDGLIRDLEQVRGIRFPIWATGVTPAAPSMDVPPGELNLPIYLGGVRVNPGDLVVADEDGVVIVPVADIERVAEAAKARAKIEEEWIEEIRRTGKLEDISDPKLAKRNVEYID
jgi:4-hydroxy-4-methyl-2-oxoglutarate aldolase